MPNPAQTKKSDETAARVLTRAVGTQIEAIEASLKAELASNPTNYTNIHEYFRFMNMVTEDGQSRACSCALAVVSDALMSDAVLLCAL
eukprot:599092-Rhodomonas_salina.1